MLINCSACGETVRVTTRLTKHCKNRLCLRRFIKGESMVFYNISHLESKKVNILHERGETFKLIQGIYFRVNFKSELDDLKSTGNLFSLKGAT